MAHPFVMALLTASLLLAGSAQAFSASGKKPEAVSPENGPTARDLEIRTYRGIPLIWGSWRLRTLTAGS